MVKTKGGHFETQSVHYILNKLLKSCVAAGFHSSSGITFSMSNLSGPPSEADRNINTRNKVTKATSYLHPSHVHAVGVVGPHLAIIRTVVPGTVGPTLLGTISWGRWSQVQLDQLSLVPFPRGILVIGGQIKEVTAKLPFIFEIN